MFFLNDNPGFVINVWNCRCMVSKWVDGVLEPAANWQELEELAAAEVCKQGGG